MVEEESRPLLSEPILDHHHLHLNHHQQQQYQQHQQNLLTLRRSTSNTTSQVALVGADVCPIESLDYEILENEFFKQDWRTRNRPQIFQYILMKWTLCFLLGIFAGLVGFFNNISIENVAGIKFVVTSNMMLANKYGQAFAVFAVSNFILTLFSTVITVYIAPAAAGSGIPEVKAYLNGVDAPEIFAPRTLIVKILGSICAVSASLHVGKAGPLVHIGACIAALLGQGGSKKYGLTCRWLRYFKNDRDRRDLVTCGSAAGIATAFRAPVGGVLFALEEVSSWWRSALLWRAFFTTAIVAVVLRALIDTCNSGKCGLFGKGGLIMFDVTAANISYHLTDLPPVIVLGIIGGILGSIYNFLLERVIRIYNFINEKGTAYKLLLACSVSIFTSCCLFGLPWLAPCRPCPAESPEACPTIGRSGNFKKFQCLPGHYNDLASLFFNTNDDAIRNLYSSGTNNEFQYLSILLFFITSFFLGILSYGIVVPSGLFVPVILTGATYGRFVGMLMGSHSNLDHGLFAVLGSASLLGGSMRNTVSLCIILLELTNNLLLLPLVMLVLLISKTVADMFNGNIYDVLVKLKGLPYLETHAEPYMRQLTVSDVITGPLQFFNGVEKVGNIVHVLKATTHHGFPVIDEPPFSDSPVLFGLVLRAHLLVLLKKKDFLHARMLASIDASRQFSAEDFAKRGSGRRDQIDDIELTAEEMEMFIDLHPFTNTSPYTVVETMSLAKALILFREVGLRHLLVVPKSSGVSDIFSRIFTTSAILTSIILLLLVVLCLWRASSAINSKFIFKNLVPVHMERVSDVGPSTYWVLKNHTGPVIPSTEWGTLCRFQMACCNKLMAYNGKYPNQWQDHLNSMRAPVVGILTRHDFMPQHILGLHPFLQRSRWKRLRFRRINLLKLFRNSQQSLVGPNP